jgi:hypothetical protein
VKIRHLSPGVGAGIGSTAAGNLNGFSQNSGKGLLQLPLYGIVHPGKPLPTTVTGAVIAHIKAQIAHTPSIPFWLLPRYPQKRGTCHFRHKPECDRKHIE